MAAKMTTKKKPIITIVEARPMEEVNFRSNSTSSKPLLHGSINSSIIPSIDSTCKISTQSPKLPISEKPAAPPPKPKRPPQRPLNGKSSFESMDTFLKACDSSGNDLYNKGNCNKLPPVPASRKSILYANNALDTKSTYGFSIYTTSAASSFNELSSRSTSSNLSSESDNHKNQGSVKFTSGISTSSISFSEARSRFGGNWLFDKETTTKPAVTARQKATIIRPKTSFFNCSSTSEEKLCGNIKTEIPKSSTIESMQNKLFQSDPNNFKSVWGDMKNAVPKSNKPCIPRKPTIIRSKPTLTKSMISLETPSIDSLINDKNECSSRNKNSSKDASTSECLKAHEKDDTVNKLSHTAETKRVVPKESLLYDKVEKDNSLVSNGDYSHKVNATFSIFDDIHQSKFSDGSVTNLISSKYESDQLQQPQFKENDYACLPLTRLENCSKNKGPPPRPLVGPRKVNPSEPTLPVKEPQPQVPRAVALFDYNAGHPDDLDFKVGDIILLESWVDTTWLKGKRWQKEGEGMFPLNFVEIIQPLPPMEENSSKTEDQRPRCVSMFDFEGIKENSELSFNAGTLLFLCDKVSSDWFDGEFDDGTGMKRGIFPVSFVDVIKDLEDTDAPSNVTEIAILKKVVALYDFEDGQEGDLSFKAGDTIDVLKMVNSEWLEGRIGHKSGMFPSNFAADL